MPAEGRPHILVVDDDASVQEALAAALERTYVVHPAATGEAACAILRTRPITGIVLDVMLGAEHGLDLVDRFQGRSAAPILILTAYSTEDLAIRAVRAPGVRDYLKKPPSLPDLLAAVARLVARPEIPPDPLARVRCHLDTHLAKAVDLEELARQAHWSEAHLRWRFGETYGTTPRRYLTEARLGHAAELLRTTGHGIQEIAERVGYPEPGNFRRLFKRCFGLCPAEYRRRHTRPANGDGSGPDSSGL
jgi:AraC-like DNA-binding protein